MLQSAVKGRFLSLRVNLWRRFWHDVLRARWAYLFISPFYILFAIFFLYPLLFSIYLSFTEWSGLGPIKFVALDNYSLLLKDKVFWQSMLNGVILFCLYVPLMTFLALVLAVILNSKRVRGFQIFRTLIFIPQLTNMFAAGYVFKYLFNQQYGLVNAVLEIFNLPPVPWLETVWGARVSLSVLIIWAWLGYNMVFMLAGLQTIPAELTEAALVDGASQLQAFWLITVPLMRPVIIFAVVLSTMGSFNLYAEVLSLTNGGPARATITPIFHIFNQAFTNFRLGGASALSYVYFLFIFVLTSLQVFYTRRQET